MQLVLIDKKELELLHQKIDALGVPITSALPDTKQPKHTKDWISLKEWCSFYSKGRSSWFDKYKEFIKHRVDGKLLIHRPSMEKYLMDKSIN